MHNSSETYLKKRLTTYKKAIVPSDFFVRAVKLKVFDRIDASRVAEKSWNWSSLLRFFEKTSAFAFSFAVAFALFNAVFFTALETSHADYVGEIMNKEGNVLIRRAHTQELVIVQSKERLFEGDTIEVADKSHAQVYFYNTGETVLASNTTVVIDKVEKVGSEDRKVALTLKKGGIDAKVEASPVESDSKLSISTPKGTVEAPMNADFSVALQENGSVKLTSEEEKIALIPEGENVAPVIVAAGEEMDTHELLELTPSLSTTEAISVIESKPVVVASSAKVKKPVTLSGAVLATATPSTTENAVLEAIPEEIVENTQVVPVPEVAAVDVFQKGLLDELSSSVDIAQVKLQSVLEAYKNKDLVASLDRMQSYYATLDRIASLIAKVKQINIAVPKQAPMKHIVDFTVRNYLTSINSAFTATKSSIKEENSEMFSAIQKKLHYLARQEAVLKSHIESQLK